MTDTCKTCNYLDNKETWGAKDGYCEYHRIYVHQSDSACSSYRGSSSGCYITTIVHDILKMSDQCEILETLRKWRNQVLSKKEEYKKILMEYDTIGPITSNRMNIDQDKELCQILYDRYLKPVCKKIEEQNEKGAIDRYQDMVRHLKFYYGLEQHIEIKNYDQQNGGHGKIYRKRIEV